MDARDSDRGDIFEGFWLLRACYAYRSDYDARSTLSVDETIAYAEQLLRRMTLRDSWRGFDERPRAA
ncbi:MAG TPA: hypothetical protein VIC83_04170 [Candidatus Limnocylindria bacterium]|jgi:hypothetical protein